jgi:GcrA cell cycle regulator
MESIWTPDLILQLGTLWRQGLSTAEIGRRLGVTKNAVVGKAHRLALDPRPSPLKRPPAPRLTSQPGPSCSWPTGHPGEKSFRFCGKRPVAGKPYCAEHAELAYVKPKDKSNAA